MHFQKQDLEGTHYYWAEHTEQLLTGQPSRRSFDRCNGNQMLFLINFYGSLSERFTLLEGKKMEKKILDDLPPEAKSELSVFNWLRGHIAI
ncbi:MAG TPA: hypothetical protein VF476_09290 [Chitinophagaceae bacterium]